MKNLLFCFCLFSASLCFAQSIEKKNLVVNPELGGDVKIKSSSIEIVGDEIIKTFELESFENGFYYLDAWINIPKIGERFVDYKISINRELSDFSFKPEISNWQSLALTNSNKVAAKIRLNKGINTVSFIGNLPMAPNVEFVKLSLDTQNTGIPDKNYKEFFEMVKSNNHNGGGQNELKGATSSKATNSASLRGTAGQIYDYTINMPVYYTSYYYFYWTSGKTVNVSVVTPNNSSYYKVDIFQSGDPIVPYYSSQGQSSGNASFNFSICTTDGYYVRVISSIYNPTGFIVDLTVDGIYLPNSVATGTGMELLNFSSSPAIFYTCKVKNGGYPWLHLEDCCDYPGNIVAHNNWGGTTSDGYYWGRANLISTTSRIRRAFVSSYYSYMPSFCSNNCCW